MKIGIDIDGVLTDIEKLQLDNSLKESIYNKIGNNVEIAEYQDITPLQETAKNGFISTESGIKYMHLCLQAAKEQADVILSICCVMGDYIRNKTNMKVYTAIDNPVNELKNMLE